MYSKVKGLITKKSVWDYHHDFPTVDVGVDHHLIPAPVKSGLEGCGATLDFYRSGGDFREPGPLGFWSPVDKGTIHIDLDYLEDLKWFSRMVLLKWAISVHRSFRAGLLTYDRKGIYWKGVDYLPEFQKALQLQSKGFDITAMQEVSRIPWFRHIEPNQNNEVCRPTHFKLLADFFKGGKAHDSSEGFSVSRFPSGRKVKSTGPKVCC